MFAGLRARTFRTALTAIAILLGVSMVTGTLVLTDQITRAFDEIFTSANAGVDVRVTPRTDFANRFGEIPTLPESMVDRVRRVPGVRAAAPEVAGLGSPVINGRYVQSTGAPSFVFALTPQPFRATRIARGAYPSRRGEVAVNQALADQEGISLGQHIGIATRSGVKPVTVTGVITFANVSSIGGATIVVAPLDDVRAWFDLRGRANTIAVAADPGVAPAVLARRISAALPRSVEVKTGQQDAEDQATQVTDAINTFLKPALLAFGFIALFVGAFIIFNTFSITVAQRTRELGLLRTIGASRRQVMASVVGEASVIGLIAGGVGLVAGYGFAALLVWIFDLLLPGGIPVAGATLGAGIVLTALLVGVLVSVLAALMPALRASRVPPIAAMSEGAEPPGSRLSRWSPIIAGALGAVGIAVVVAGLTGGGDTTSRLLTMAAGALLVFLAIGGLGRYLVPPLARVVGWPLERLPGASGRLARQNTTRNPARTAATAAALMIGIGLVAFVAVFAQGLKASFTGTIDRTIRGDLVVTGRNFQTVPAASLGAIAHTPGVADVVGVLTDQVRVPGAGQVFAYGVPPAPAERTLSLEWVDGSDALLGGLGGDAAVVEKDVAAGAHVDVGGMISAVTSTGRRSTFRVTGIYRDPQLFNNGLIVSDAAFVGAFTTRDPFSIFVSVQPGADPSVVQGAVERSLRPYPVAEVRTNAQYRQQIGDQVDSVLYLLYALLAMSGVISVFGIVNTLVLSITERTREIGMLRAIGVTRSELRRMVRYESTITSGIGGIVGIVVGVLLAWVLSLGLKDEGIVFSIPWLQLLVFLVVAFIAGVLAAVLPARRAARLDPLDALHHD